MIAAGVWTPEIVRMMSPAEAAEPVSLGIQPRKGHLLELPKSQAPVVNHGLMEIGYAKVSQKPLGLLWKALPEVRGPSAS